MDWRPTVEQEIAEVRVRRTWRGKLVLQLRRHARKATLTPPPRLETKWEDSGLGPWRDADGNNAAEVAEVFAMLTPNV